MARILIVDDMEPNRYMLQALLTGHGHEASTAANGVEALAIARTTPVDLIIADILMPVMDGFTLCREWRDDSNLRAIPFVFFTATYTDPKDIDFGLSLGADCFLIKPMDPTELMVAIEEILSGKSSKCPPPDDPPAEALYLQTYNQALIRKLEDKMFQLEESNRRLEAEVQVRRRTEGQLLRYKTAIEHTAESIFLTDARGLIEHVNPAFEKTTGYMAAEARGRFPAFLWADRSDPESWADIDNKLKTGEVWRGRLTSMTKTGTVTETETTISPIPAESTGVDGFVTVMRDVTQQLALEKHLAQAQKMEAIGTLAGGIAHDFNNILGAVIGYIQLALLKGQVKAGVANYLNSALEACDRAKHLVQQILTFSRKSDRVRVMMDLVPLLKECQKFLRASIPSTIEIRVNLEGRSRYVLADPIQIQQIILNLCTNAVHAMRDTGGLLEIGLRYLEMDEVTARHFPGLKAGPFLLVSVADNGHGMDKETLTRIFEPFFTTKERGQGTGLGLSVAHGIVKSHEGVITVYSEPGRGTTFNVYLPEAEGLPEMTLDAKVESPVTGNEHVLFVDDERDLVEIGREMLEKLGYHVTTALSAREALEKFAASPQSFNLIVTDQTMPLMTGDQLAREALKIRPDIPVLVCTGFSAFDAAEKARAAGITKLMTKPLEYRELARSVRNLLDGESG